MKLFRFLAYSFAFFLGAVFAFRGTNSFPAPPPKQYQPKFVVRQPTLVGDVANLPQLDDQAQLGKTLFYNNCAACHNRNMKDNLTGPALGKTRENWSEYPEKDLYDWIRNSRAMIDAKHPRAVQLWSDWGPTVMPNFQGLADEDIDALLAYMEAVYY